MKSKPSKQNDTTRAKKPAIQFYLVVPCRDEEFQRELYEELRNRGLRCRVLSL